MSIRKVLAKRLSILVLTSLILLGFGISAQAASISGTVRDSSGDAITGMVGEIQVAVSQGDPCGWRQVLFSVPIDDSGDYTISVPSAGYYYLQTHNLNLSDYINEWWTGDTDPSSYYCNAAQPVDLSGGNQTGIDFKLTMGGSISGHVYESDGTTPIQGMWLNAFTGQCYQNEVAWADADEDGAFTLRGIPPAGVFISACATCQGMNYVNEWWESGDGTVDCNSAALVPFGLPDRDFTLEQGGTVSGLVLNHSGVPQANVMVNYGNDALDYWSNTLTDGSGQFQLAGLPGGAFEMTIEPDVDTGLAWFMRYYYLNSGEDKDLGTIRLQKGALVKGHINYLGAPLSGIEFWYGGRFELGWGQTALATDPDPGYFELRLPVGSYALNLDEEEGYVMVPAEIEVTDANAIYDLDNLPSGRPVRSAYLAYVAPNGDQITGTVSGTGIAHNGDFGVIVFLNDQEFTPDNAGGIGILGFGEPGSDYTLYVPPTLDYDRNSRNVQVALALFSNGPDDTESITIVDVVQDQVTPASGVDLSYLSAGQTVDGYVKDHATDEGLYYSYVILYSQPGDVFTGIVETDHTGHFVFYNVPAGTYRLAVTAPDYTNTQWSSNFDVTSTDVTVPDILLRARAGLAALPGILFLLLGN